MSNTIAIWLLQIATVCVTQLNSEIYQHRPTIKTSDGDLILQPAPDNNIYLQTTGAQSCVYVGTVDILKALNIQKDLIPYQTTATEHFDEYFSGANGILQRLQVLENKTPTVFDTTSLNITSLLRKVNSLNRKVLELQNQINYRPKHECTSHPCQHGGTCLNLVDGYHCLCPSNWEGKHCDVDVNECRNFAGTDLGCQNGALCINKPGTYECLCKPNWFGVHCTTKAKDCASGDYEMCGHGTCVPVTTGEGIKCICHQGWTTNATSVECLTDVNECDSHQGMQCSVNPKVECINVPGSFRCGRCPAGYEGDGYICNDIDECITIRNGGCSPLVTCHNTVGSRICGSCPPGYQGDGVTCTSIGLCRINNGGCHYSAQCSELPTPTGRTVQCVCPVGMDGDGLGLSGCYVSRHNYTTACEHSPCGIHGRCHRVRSGYTCICDEGYGGAHCDTSTNSCAGNPCHNGGVCRQDTNSGFRCECTAQYTGSLCEVRAETCGGLLDAQEGNIVFPSSNTSTYNNNVQCAWLIHTDDDKVLNVTFSKFIVELSPECTADFLQVHDGRKSSSQLIGRFCGNTLPNGGKIVSSHNYLYLWFHTDGTVAKDGFALHWTSIKPVCGGEMDATTHGHISSPGSPGRYPPNRDCYWHLRAVPGKIISIHFFGVDIEAHSNCSFDFIAIHDGEHTTDPLLNRYCTSTQSAPVHSTGSDMLIHFHSDAFGSGNGFQIAYAPANGIPGCGGFFTARQGHIVAPKYNGPLINHVLCEYKIKTDATSKIKLTFKSFKINYQRKCKKSYLKIYDGSSVDSKLVGRFCGSILPATLTSSSNMLYLVFSTSLKETNNNDFLITYESTCKEVLLGDSGIITSPSYPFDYSRNTVCDYVIETEPGKAIQLTFQDFDVGSKTGVACTSGAVEIRDGADGSASLLDTYCGRLVRAPPVLTSTYNYMHIRFQSGDSSSPGFYANYTTVDIACGGIYRNTTGLINHPRDERDTYEYERTCTWLIIAPRGMRIELVWRRFDVKQTPGCVSEYMQLVELDDDDKAVAGARYCGTRTPPALTTTHQLELHLVSAENRTTSRYPRSEFSLSYTFLDERDHCGGNFSQSDGIIRSPGWPDPYDDHLDCTWIITVPAGQQIALNIANFSLEYCCRCDYLEIRNGVSAKSPLIRQVCGVLNSQRIVSIANTLYLRFHTDVAVAGSGFVIKWESTVTGCGGTLTSATGSITSPNYPNNYHENAECFYRIVTNAGLRIRILFTEIDLETSAKCVDDYVQVYDGRDTDAPSLGKYCGTSRELANIETTGQYAFVKFRSDYSVGGKGFVLNYMSVCTGTIKGRYGVIETPNFPNSYPLNIECSWTLQAPKGNRINVTFTHFNIYESYLPYWRRPSPYQSLHHSYIHRSFGYPRMVPWYSDYYDDYDYYLVSHEKCSFDYVQIKEGSTVTNKLCGITIPDAVTTKSNVLQIIFSSMHLSDHRSGFRLEWVIYGCGGHIFGNSGTLALDKSLASEKEMECEWLLETTPGRSFNIRFTDIYMLQSDNCSIDAIEIYNGRDTKAPLLSKICHQQHASIQSDSNYMLVRLVKSSTLKDVHFTSRFHYTRSMCGGVIKSTSGFFYSKNYPKNYIDNLDCIWYIQVPENHRIEINFVDVDLYSSDFSECGDSILIYDNGNYKPSSNYTHRICPNSNTTHIVTKYRRVMVQFKSDSAGTAKGFKAHFTVTCGAVITAKRDGIITKDKYINHSNKTCTWTVIARMPDQKISLTFTHISLPKDTDVVTNRTCPSVFLRVLDGNDDDAPLIGEYCGRKVPPMIVTHGNALTVQLGTYTDTMFGEFSLHYSPITNACGSTLTAEEGAIASPLYPSPYPVDADCEWLISTSPGNAAYITFEQFDLEYSEGCNEDYLELRENNGVGKLLGVYCGSDVPTNHTRAANIYIKFHSSSSVSRQGFLLHYEYLHENYIQGERGAIASPLYPTPYIGTGEYSWRVIASGHEAITLTVDNLDIPSHGDVSYNKLTIYNGYDNTAPVLEQLHGAIDHKTIQASSNAVYIVLTMDASNTGSAFHITWAQSSNDEELSERTCGSNHIEILLPGQASVIKIPGNESQASFMNCVWQYKTLTGRHLSITFTDVDLEGYDRISIYSADSPEKSKIVKNINARTSVSGELNFDIYMKIELNSEALFSPGGARFHAQVTSKCGGLLTDPSGEFGPTWLDVNPTAAELRIQYNWTVKVRPGRTIKFKFVHFNITGGINDCVTCIILRDGDSVEAPLLGSGRYCGREHERKTDLETASNALFVSYTRKPYANTLGFHSFRIYYEEIKYVCGSTSTLTPDHSWETINSPNYPLLSIPYSECAWTFTAPPGEIIAVDFNIARFDLSSNLNCAYEFVEVRDGSSNLSPLIHYQVCGKDIFFPIFKTTGNAVYIKYSTQLAQPSMGFKANVSIDTCGGTIVADFGEVTSPGYPQMRALPQGTVCEWRIIASRDHTILITPEDISLPKNQTDCTSKVDIAVTYPFNDTATVIKSICGHDDKTNLAEIETYGYNVTITLKFGNPHDWLQMSEHRGFRISFSSSVQECSDTISASEGYITTPNYPHEIKSFICFWSITSPDIDRRIRLEVLDINTNKQSIFVHTDLLSSATIEPILNANTTSNTEVYESVDNNIAVLLIPTSLSTLHRFKARFTSDEPALCGGELSAMSGEIIEPDIQHGYTCKWHYNGQSNGDNDSNLTYSSTFIKVNINNISITEGTELFKQECRGLPSIVITSSMTRTYSRNICVMSGTYKIPSTVFDVKASKSGHEHLSFNLRWKLQPCGGTLHLGSDPINIINMPDSYNDSLDCSWTVMASENDKIEITMEGSFLLDCNDEYIEIAQDLNTDVADIGSYCNINVMTKPLLIHYSIMYIQYHSKVKNNTSIKLMARTVAHQCGGLFTSKTHQNIFTSPNYPKSYTANQECVWEIHAELGYRVSLQFIERFVIEERPNCTKDVVIIYDWIDDAYVEMARVCGRHPPPAYNSTHDRLKVVLRTDAETNLDGFKAQWTPICGGKYIATGQEQMLYSPGYPDKYAGNMHCVYDFVAPNEQKIILRFHTFDLQGIYPTCSNDRLSVTHIISALDRVYCGNHMPSPIRKYGHITLEFKTDTYGHRKGFKLSYYTNMCGGIINQPTVITSSLDMDVYDENMNCTWLIEAPSSMIVVVKFVYIDLESNMICDYDYVALYDGLNIDEDKRLALLCGHANSTTVLTSTGNTMVFQFVTDSTRNYKGFKAGISFSYSEAVGCGGRINLQTNSTRLLTSPLISGAVYENYLHCLWSITSPPDTVIKITFTKFNIASCKNNNQTTFEYSECDCDSVEIKDGLTPSSLVMGTYCGHTLPPQLITSANVMSVSLSTDGDLASSGFEATLTVQQTLCGESVIPVSFTPHRVKFPGDAASLPSGLHCIYHFDNSAHPNYKIRISIVNLLLRPPINDSAGSSHCVDDKIIISSHASNSNITAGKHLIMHHQTGDSFWNYYFYESNVHLPSRVELCGHKEAVDFYTQDNTLINLITSSDANNALHRNIQIEVAFTGFCGRNYTEAQGRILSSYGGINTDIHDCYTLITAPENYTISAYFLDVTSSYDDSTSLLEIYDGNNTSARKLTSTESDDYPVFSTGRHMLLHNHKSEEDILTYDMNYVTTNKGVGCGGKLNNIVGAVTSPLYPNTYRHNSVCEWVLETPVSTQAMIKFTKFDLGENCEQNYLQFVDSKGLVVRTFCSDWPADYTSSDNYIKLVFYTSLSNSGRGWSAKFVGVRP